MEQRRIGVAKALLSLLVFLFLLSNMHFVMPTSATVWSEYPLMDPKYTLLGDGTRVGSQRVSKKGNEKQD